MNDRRDPSRDPDEAFRDRARATLDASVDALDAATLSKLNRARQRALAAPTRRPLVAWGGALAATAASVVVLVATTRAPTDDVAPPPSPGIGATAWLDAEGADDAALATSEALDLYDNLEFYAWLDTQQRDG